MFAEDTPYGTFWNLADHLGTIRDVATYNFPSGGTSLADTLTYDAFGNLLSESNAAGGPLVKYTGKFRDPVTGKPHQRENTGIKIAGTMPRTARWLSRDPIGFAAGDANLYRYVGNGPTRATDPIGLQAYAYPWSVPGSGQLRPPQRDIDAAERRAATAAVNGLATATVSTATLGLSNEPVHLIPVTPAELSNPHYQFEQSVFSIGGEGVIAVATVGAGTTASLTTSTIGRVAGRGLAYYDIAGNALGAGRAGTSIYNDGLNLGNGAGLVAGGIGLGGNALGRRLRRTATPGRSPIPRSSFRLVEPPQICRIADAPRRVLNSLDDVAA